MALPVVADPAGPGKPDILLEVIRDLAREMCTQDEIVAVLSSPNCDGKNAQKARRRGPKGKPIDLVQLEKLCALQCTQAEIGDFFGVSRPTIERRLREPEYRAAMERGYALGHISLRRMQFQAAMAGNPTMLIWLGKQYLGQSDHPKSADAAGEQQLIRVVYVTPVGSREAEPATQLPPAAPPALPPASANGSESTTQHRNREGA
jgi:hypothetical protein